MLTSSGQGYIIDNMRRWAAYVKQGKLIQMFTQSLQFGFRSLAKQPVAMPQSWSLISNLHNSDRTTSEGYISPGSIEGSGYA